MAVRKKKKTQQSNGKASAASRKKSPGGIAATKTTPQQPSFDSPFLKTFKKNFIRAVPDCWAAQGFDRARGRAEIPLIVRILLEISDMGRVPTDVPESPLRKQLEDFLKAQHWRDKRVRGVQKLMGRHKEIARITDFLLRVYHFGDGTGSGTATEWPPP